MSLVVNDDLKGINPYIDYMIYLFELTSTDNFPDEVNVPNDAWNEYIDLLYSATGQALPKKVKIDDLPQIYFDNPSRDMVLGFSGGSDSTTHAAYLMDREDVDKLYLVHMENLNRAYPNEKNAAKTVAEYLGAEYIPYHIKFSGKNRGVESPVKNHLVLSVMIPTMIEHSIVRASEGVFPNDTLDVIGGLYGLSDSYDLFKAYEKAIQRTFPQYRFVICFKNWTHEYAYLMKYHKDVVPLYQSCMLPDRYRASIRRTNESKYGIKLLPNRCLSCWKCCKEALLLQMFGYQKTPSDVIVKQIYPTLRRNYAREVGISEQEANSVNIKDIVGKFMFLDDIDRYTKDMSLVEKDFEEVKQYNLEDCWD